MILTDQNYKYYCELVLCVHIAVFTTYLRYSRNLFDSNFGYLIQVKIVYDRIFHDFIKTNSNSVNFEPEQGNNTKHQLIFIHLYKLDQTISAKSLWRNSSLHFLTHSIS